MAHRLGRLLAYVVLVLIALVGLAPFLILLLISSKTKLGVLDVPPSLDIDWSVVRRNYEEVIVNKFFLRFLENSIIVTSISTLAALVLGVPAAYAFSRLNFKGRERWATTILTFRFMPAVAVAVPIFLLIRTLNLLDTYLGLILPYVAFSLPLVVWIMIGFFDEVPREIDDAAMVDGCTRVSALWRVILPLVRPGLVVAAIFSVIFVWNEFLVGLFIVSTQETETIPIGAAGLITADRPIDWNIAAAIGIFTVIPVFLFSLFVQKYIVRGVTSGAIS